MIGWTKMSEHSISLVTWYIYEEFSRISVQQCAVSNQVYFIIKVGLARRQQTDMVFIPKYIYEMQQKWTMDVDC